MQQMFVSNDEPVILNLKYTNRNKRIQVLTNTFGRDLQTHVVTPSPEAELTADQDNAITSSSFLQVPIGRKKKAKKARLSSLGQ